MKKNLISNEHWQTVDNYCLQNIEKMFVLNIDDYHNIHHRNMPTLLETHNISLNDLAGLGMAVPGIVDNKQKRILSIDKKDAGGRPHAAYSGNYRSAAASNRVCRQHEYATGHLFSENHLFRSKQG